MRNDLVAYCDSTICTSRDKNHAKIEKIVPQGSYFCPDCKRALLWRARGSRAKVVSNYKQARKEMTQKLKKHMERK